MFPNDYGHFSEDGREYVITRPDTPRPWVNVICPGDYGLVVSQAGGGYSWKTHATLNRVTRWEQDLVRDEWGKFLYCRDREDGAFWSLSHQPVQHPKARYECRHGVGYSTLRCTARSVESEWTLFVPPDLPLEIWTVRLRNRSARPRRLDLFTYFEWNLGPAPDTHREFHRLFHTLEYDERSRALFATKRLNTIAEHGRGEPWNVEWPHVAFHAASVRPAGVEGDKTAFLGRHGSPAAPAAVRAGRLGGTTGKWLDAVGSLHVAVSLPARSERVMVFTLGVAESRDEAARLARRYTTPTGAAKALSATKKFWASYLDPLTVETPDPAFDLMTNTWLKYQALSSRLWGRTGYSQPGGAYGFRDQLQDSQVFLPLRPEHTRAQLLLHARHQKEDGTALHWWHPLTEEGIQKPLNDDLLWLPFVLLNYLRETVDFGVLDERVPYLRDKGQAGEASGSLYEHCRRAIDSFWKRLSPRGVPRMGAGDWNDGLSVIGRRLKSESVWLAHFLVGILEQWAELEERRPRGDRRAATRYRTAAARMRAAVNDHFWDGDWYVRATKDSGEVIGSKRNRDGKIFLNAQTWAILHGVVPESRLRRVLRSLERHLYREYGPLLLWPAYREPDADIGYLTRYTPGARENGGLYTHAGVWAIQAECLLGNADRAWKVWRSFSPPYRGESPDHYQVEPYVTPGNVDGPDSPHFGRGGWTWYTGSAAWLFRIQTEWMLGVRPTYDGLLVRPCLPKEWKGFHMRRQFRGARYEIIARRGRRPGITVDGRRLDGAVVPAFPDGRTHRVVVTL
jgi:cellobiose phosphorylase